MKQYGIKVGRTVLQTRFKTRFEAAWAIKKMEEADKAYDIPNHEKRVIVERDVSPWRVSKKED